MHRFIAAWFLTAVLSGCESETQNDDLAIKSLKSEDISMSMEIYSDDNVSATAQAHLFSGNLLENVDVPLEADDSIKLLGSDEAPFEKSDSGIYVARLEGVGEGSEIRFALAKAPYPSAVDNVGIVPTQFNLSEVLPGASRSTDNIEIKWSPPGAGLMTLIFTGSCIITTTQGVSDSGQYLLKPGDLQSLNLDDPRACQITLTATRINAGMVDPSLGYQSRFILGQRRTQVFKVQP